MTNFARIFVPTSMCGSAIYEDMVADQDDIVIDDGSSWLPDGDLPNLESFAGDPAKLLEHQTRQLLKTPSSVHSVTQQRNENPGYASVHVEDGTHDPLKPISPNNPDMQCQQEQRWGFSVSSDRDITHEFSYDDWLKILSGELGSNIWFGMREVLIAQGKIAPHETEIIITPVYRGSTVEVFIRGPQERLPKSKKYQFVHVSFAVDRPLITKITGRHKANARLALLKNPCVALSLTVYQKAASHLFELRFKGTVGRQEPKTLSQLQNMLRTMRFRKTVAELRRLRPEMQALGPCELKLSYHIKGDVVSHISFYPAAEEAPKGALYQHISITITEQNEIMITALTGTCDYQTYPTLLRQRELTLARPVLHSAAADFVETQFMQGIERRTAGWKEMDEATFLQRLETFNFGYAWIRLRQMRPEFKEDFFECILVSRRSRAGYVEGISVRTVYDTLPDDEPTQHIHLKGSLRRGVTVVDIKGTFWSKSWNALLNNRKIKKGFSVFLQKASFPDLWQGLAAEYSPPLEAPCTGTIGIRSTSNGEQVAEVYWIPQGQRMRKKANTVFVEVAVNAAGQVTAKRINTSSGFVRAHENLFYNTSVRMERPLEAKAACYAAQKFVRTTLHDQEEESDIELDAFLSTYHFRAMRDALMRVQRKLRPFRATLAVKLLGTKIVRILMIPEGEVLPRSGEYIYIPLRFTHNDVTLVAKTRGSHARDAQALLFVNPFIGFRHRLYKQTVPNHLLRSLLEEIPGTLNYRKQMPIDELCQQLTSFDFGAFAERVWQLHPQCPQLTLQLTGRTRRENKLSALKIKKHNPADQQPHHPTQLIMHLSSKGVTIFVPKGKWQNELYAALQANPTLRAFRLETDIPPERMRHVMIAAAHSRQTKLFV